MVSNLAPGTVDPAFWAGKRVFLTGHTGFKGGWMALWLQQMGALVTGFALAPPTSPALFDVARIANGMTSIIGDIRDREVLERALVDRRPDSAHRSRVECSVGAGVLIQNRLHPIDLGWGNHCCRRRSRCGRRRRRRQGYR